MLVPPPLAFLMCSGAGRLCRPPRPLFPSHLPPFSILHPRPLTYTPFPTPRAIAHERFGLGGAFYGPGSIIFPFPLPASLFSPPLHPSNKFPFISLPLFIPVLLSDHFSRLSPSHPPSNLAPPVWKILRPHEAPYKYCSRHGAGMPIVTPPASGGGCPHACCVVSVVVVLKKFCLVTKDEIEKWGTKLTY